MEYPLKDKIVCTDFSRRKLKYKDENGNLIEDPEMIKLSQKLFKAIEEKEFHTYKWIYNRIAW